ncbi:MAG: hypothetical protein P1V13_06220 [Rhizobiaceae bacterium]|nr:hypothetical protein [Rhizobiaceae bacterium]
MPEQNKPVVDEASAYKIELLKRMVICHADLQTSLSAITFLNEIDENESYDYVELRRYKCFEIAFVVSYGRAFTKSLGSKYGQLSMRKVGVKLSEKEKKLHNQILAARHGKYAHSDMRNVHARIDLHTIDDDDFQFQYHRIQWDEGIDFVTINVHDDIMDLIRKIMRGLNKSTRFLAIELEPYLPLYITPESSLD